MSKRDKILSLVLVLVVLATLLIIYFVYLNNPEVSYEGEFSGSDMSMEANGESPDLDILQDPRFNSLKSGIRINFPENIGKDNPFAP